MPHPQGVPSQFLPPGRFKPSDLLQVRTTLVYEGSQDGTSG